MGHFIWKGVLTEDREIVVKRLFAKKEQGVKELFNEVNLVSRAQHKTLVKLFGCSVDWTDRLLVYEYIPNKSLDKFLVLQRLETKKRQVFTWDTTSSIALYVVRSCHWYGLCIAILSFFVHPQRYAKYHLGFGPCKPLNMRYTRRPLIVQILIP